MSNTSDQDVMVDATLDPDDAEMQKVWQALQSTTDPTDREYLLVQLAELGGKYHDFSDADLSDSVHKYFEELRFAQDRYHTLAVRVGRMVVRLMENSQVLANCKQHAKSEPPPPRGDGTAN